MNVSFPKNPPDGMIFEAAVGLFFQFHTSIHCWIRVDGIEALGIATPTTPGLMSSDDLDKIDKLIIPPPQSSLKGEDCPITFSEGRLRLTSTDESMSVSTSLDVINKIGQTIVGGLEPWALHENTVGVNFKLNIDALLEELKKTGKFTQVLIQGRQGSRGEKGDDGIDELDTGPKGKRGVRGANSPYDGAFSPDINAFEIAGQSSNRAIVDIRTEQTQEGNFLVATRANIGNPLACPKEIKPKDISSPLVLVLNQKENALLHKLESPNDCGNPCTVCVTSLHHINLDILSDAIFQRFKERVSQLKKEKEDLVTLWLRSMITMFNEQKHAICCALENCRSAKRNEDTRRFIEAQRIQAAQADMALIIDGSKDRTVIDMDADKVCNADSELVEARRGIGCDCSLQYTLDAQLHITDPRGKFINAQPVTISTSQDNAFGAGRIGILNVREQVQKNANEQIQKIAGFKELDRRVSTSTLTLNSDVIPPAQTSTITDWKLSIDNFSILNIEPISSAGDITMDAAIYQEGPLGPMSVAQYKKDIPITLSGTQVILLDSIGPTDLSRTNFTKLTLVLTISTRLIPDEAVSVVTVDYAMGAMKLVGSSDLAQVTITLKDDWNTNSWTFETSHGTLTVVPGGAASMSSGHGFVALDLPAGRYVAEIIDCCANLSTDRAIWTGVAAIEYNLRTGTDDSAVVANDTIMFPDLGSFDDVSNARMAYLGTTVSFEHAGGAIRSWIADPDQMASNNDGRITICIKPAECVEGFNISSIDDTDAIFVYRNEINPLNLIGFIHPFVGDIDAVANYNYNSGTVGADSLKFGPSRDLLRTKSFFYYGIDGLSFYTLHGSTGLPSSNNIKMRFVTENNREPIELKVADDIEEVTSSTPNDFTGDWQLGTFGSDGIVIGPYDIPSSGSWAITVTPTDFGIQEVWEIDGSDGNTTGIFVDANGIGTSHANDKIIFTPIKSGCLMPFKQIIWLERGHRIGASCSCVVDLDGQKYIIVRRSIGDDITCGGGESLSNPCIAEFLSLGIGHPAIAWPTLNGEEFLGIPTSGAHGFTFDSELSQRVIDKIQAGDIENIHGDPKTNIGVVLFPVM